MATTRLTTATAVEVDEVTTFIVLKHSELRIEDLELRIESARHCLFLSSHSIGSHSSTLLPSGSRIQANLPFSADSGPFTVSIPLAFSCPPNPRAEDQGSRRTTPQASCDSPRICRT